MKTSNLWKILAALLSVFGNLANAQDFVADDIAGIAAGLSVAGGVPPVDLAGNIVSNGGGWSLQAKAPSAEFLSSSATNQNVWLTNVSFQATGTFLAWIYATNAAAGVTVCAGSHDPNDVSGGLDYSGVYFRHSIGSLNGSNEFTWTLRNNYGIAAGSMNSGFGVKMTVPINQWTSLVAAYDLTRRTTNNAVTTNTSVWVNGIAQTVYGYNDNGAGQSTITNPIVIPYFMLGGFGYQISNNVPLRSSRSITGLGFFAYVPSKIYTANEALEFHSRGVKKGSP